MAPQSVEPDTPDSEPADQKVEKEEGSVDDMASATADALDAEVVEQDDPEAGDSEAAAGEQIDWEARYEAESARAEEQTALALRLHADMENLRKRSARDVENARKFALEKFANELLPVCDSLEMGLDAANKGDADLSSIREGTELTLKMLVSAMEKFHLVALDPSGQQFDPERHQAMTTQVSVEHAPNTVMAVMQKGYTLNNRLLRPALVMVSKANEDGA